ncbi:chemotaxis protein CheW [Calothrix sp. UHCC 0171]|uniref:chemotaxis protein CheW n=1 Tax=Calothrix sp. UHCC 0171 TaxID=3110245 RepID=UPI002B21405A|nr:chemotaxis protein CheW [Calothrix sp. UHCC 0171]MEA5573313.1 chemotaxis protein CheW [Calothrix sp. UHCC 0171]
MVLDIKQKFLTFQLGSKDTAVISLANIIEVLQISASEICGVPQMPSYIYGVYNWRGEMVWLIDLEAMLGYSSSRKISSLIPKIITIIVQHEGKSLGLLVNQLMDIDYLDVSQIKPANTELFPAAINSVLAGYFIGKNEEIILSLDALAILQSPNWNLHN